MITDICKTLIDLFHFKDGVLERKGIFSKTSTYIIPNPKIESVNMALSLAITVF